MIPLELTLSKIHKELQRASRVLRTPVYAHSFSKGEKRGTLNANAERERNLRNAGVWGKVFRKIRFAYFLIFWRNFGGAGIKKENT